MFWLLVVSTVPFGPQLIWAAPQDLDQQLTAEPEEIKLERRPVDKVYQDYLYQVLISELDEEPRCGGVLVSVGFIITSATCVLEFGGIKKFLEEAVVYGGGTSLLVDLGDVLDAALHPNYTDNPYTFDVAVVRYKPEDNGPKIKTLQLSDSWSGDTNCTMTSWWSAANTPVERLTALAVRPMACAPPRPGFLCFDDLDPPFLEEDYGSPVVCGGVELVGLVPRRGGDRAIDLTSDLEWVTSALIEMADRISSNERELEQAAGDAASYLLQIMVKLEQLTQDRSWDRGRDQNDQFHSLNNQIVVPLSYVLFAMLVFFFVLLLFIILFTVVLVYYSRKKYSRCLFTPIFHDFCYTRAYLQFICCVNRLPSRPYS